MQPDTVPILTVQSIMNSDVYTLSSNQSALDALKTFAERGISGAPVLNSDGTLAGFLSDGDILRYLSIRPRHRSPPTRSALRTTTWNRQCPT